MLSAVPLPTSAQTWLPRRGKPKALHEAPSTRRVKPRHPGAQGARMPSAKAASVAPRATPPHQSDRAFGPAAGLAACQPPPSSSRGHTFPEAAAPPRRTRNEKGTGYFSVDIRGEGKGKGAWFRKWRMRVTVSTGGVSRGEAAERAGDGGQGGSVPAELLVAQELEPMVVRLAG